MNKIDLHHHTNEDKDSRKNYNIKLLPGIDLEFQMEGNNGNKSVKGHLNLIFHDEYKIDELEDFFKEHYDSDSQTNFRDYFPHIINKLQENNFKIYYNAWFCKVLAWN